MRILERERERATIFWTTKVGRRAYFPRDSYYTSLIVFQTEIAAT